MVVAAFVYSSLAPRLLVMEAALFRANQEVLAYRTGHAVPQRLAGVLTARATLRAGFPDGRAQGALAGSAGAHAVAGHGIVGSG
jgi:hypothetical protein